ncbi:magnesium/cobalt transporter CorA [Chloroflexota bacterium]
MNTDGEVIHETEVKQLAKWCEGGEGLLWVDITGTSTEDAKLLEDTFNFHHLLVEDCMSTGLHSPKVDDFGNYLFMILHGINYTAQSEIVETNELAIFLGKNFVVSQHNNLLYSAEYIKQMIEKDGRPMKKGPDFLAHKLIDTLVDNVLPTIDKMSELAEEIEEEVLRNPQQSTMEALLKLKRSSLRVHRVMAPQREVLNKLSRGEFSIIGSDAHVFYRDVYDHLVRIEDLNQTIRERCDNLLSTYLSSIANRQNETMKVLAIVAAIFMPLTLLAGIYGMNFENMPELRWQWGYFAVLGVMGVVIAVVLWRFWAGRWIGWGRRQVKKLKPFVIEPEKLIGHIKSKKSSNL